MNIEAEKRKRDDFWDDCQKFVDGKPEREITIDVFRAIGGNEQFRDLQSAVEYSKTINLHSWKVSWEFLVQIEKGTNYILLPGEIKPAEECLTRKFTVHSETLFPGRILLTDNEKLQKGLDKTFEKLALCALLNLSYTD